MWSRKEKTCHSYTGEAEGIEYYATKESAEEVLHKLQRIIEKYKIDKKFKISCIKDRLPDGEIIQYYNFLKKNLKINMY